jgi:hypothetical protein
MESYFVNVVFHVINQRVGKKKLTWGTFVFVFAIYQLDSIVTVLMLLSQDIVSGFVLDSK